MAKRILITGCTGYVGQNLLPYLREQLPGDYFIGTSRAPIGKELSRLLDESSQANLEERSEVDDLLNRVRPHALIHLAARRHGELPQLLSANVLASDMLFAGFRAVAGSGARILVVGSSAELGYCDPIHLPAGESAPCRPIDYYGISKLAQSLLAQSAYQRYGQAIVRVRLFNLIGPGLPDSLLPGRCVSLLKSKLRDPTIPLKFGELTTERDYTDIRDVSRALVLAYSNGKPGELYHIGTGRAVSGREVVQAFLAQAGLQGAQVLDEPGVHSAGVPIQVADATKASAELGWRPEISFEQSARDMWKHSENITAASDRATAHSGKVPSLIGSL